MYFFSVIFSTQRNRKGRTFHNCKEDVFKTLEEAKAFAEEKKARGFYANVTTY